MTTEGKAATPLPHPVLKVTVAPVLCCQGRRELLRITHFFFTLSTGTVQRDLEQLATLPISSFVYERHRVLSIGYPVNSKLSEEKADVVRGAGMLPNDVIHKLVPTRPRTSVHTGPQCCFYVRRSNLFVSSLCWVPRDTHAGNDITNINSLHSHSPY